MRQVFQCASTCGYAGGCFANALQRLSVTTADIYNQDPLGVFVRLLGGPGHAVIGQWWDIGLKASHGHVEHLRVFLGLVDDLPHGELRRPKRESQGSVAEADRLLETILVKIVWESSKNLQVMIDTACCLR